MCFYQQILNTISSLPHLPSTGGESIFRPFRAVNPVVHLHRASPGAIILSPFQGLIQGLVVRGFLRHQGVLRGLWDYVCLTLQTHVSPN
jgi:hypothetical protein